MSQGLASTLQRLLERGSVPLSSLSAAQREQLRGLREAGVLKKERQGGGWRLVVAHREAVARFAQRQFPSGLDLSEEEAGDTPRAESVLWRRSAKWARRTVGEVVLLKGRAGAALEGPERLPVGGLTQKFGVAAVLLAEDAEWAFEGTIAVVENLEAFLHVERLGVNADMACYAGGRLSDRVIRWLASPPMQTAEIVHCGDYDPVGVDEYLKLKTACRGRVRFYVPNGLEELVERYGNRRLIRKSSEVLARLRDSTDPTVTYLVELMDRHGKGLEQEVLLTSARDGGSR